MPFYSLWAGLHKNPIYRQARTRAQNSLVLQKDVFNRKILSRVIFTYHHRVLKQTTTIAGDFSQQIKYKWVGHFNQREPYTESNSRGLTDVKRGTISNMKNGWDDHTLFKEGTREDEIISVRGGVDSSFTCI